VPSTYSGERRERLSPEGPPRPTGATGGRKGISSLLRSNEISFKTTKSLWDTAKRAAVKAAETLRIRRDEYETKEAEPDTTEERLAEIEQRQTEVAQERMENATAMSVPRLLMEFSDSRNTLKRQ